MMQNNFLRTVYTLEFSKKRKIYYFYNHITSESIWEKPENGIIIDRAYLQDVINTYEIIINQGTEGDKLEFINTVKNNAVEVKEDNEGIVLPTKINETRKQPELSQLLGTLQRKIQKRKKGSNTESEQDLPQTNKYYEPSTSSGRFSLDSLSSESKGPPVTDLTRRSLEATSQKLSLQEKSDPDDDEYPKQNKRVYKTPMTDRLHKQLEELKRQREEQLGVNPSQDRSRCVKRSSGGSPAFSSSSQDSFTMKPKISFKPKSDPSTNVQEKTNRFKPIILSGDKQSRTNIGWKAEDNDFKSESLKIFMKGLPFRATESDVINFFAPVSPIEIKIILNEDGKPSGYAEVEFSSPEDKSQAMRKHREYMGNRYVELFPREPPNFPKGETEPMIKRRWSDQSRENKDSVFSETGLGNVKRRKTIHENTLTASKLHTEPSSTNITNVVEKQKVFDLRTKLILKEQEKCPETVTSPVEKMEIDEIHPVTESPQQNENETPKKQITQFDETLNPAEFEHILLVCDTCSLLKYHQFLEVVLARGNYLDFPIIMVIPYVVFLELDTLKTPKEEGINPRMVIRTLNESIHSKNKNIKRQDGSLSKKACCSMELNNNDDLVLNCALQTKEESSSSQLTILITEDKNLCNKASCFKMLAHSWESFKKWLREWKYKPKESDKITMVPEYLEDEKMIIDSGSDVSESPRETLRRSDSFNPSKFPQGIKIDSVDTARTTTKLQNSIKSVVNDLKVDLQDFLRQVLLEAIKKEYGSLEKHAVDLSVLRNLIEVIKEIQRRWMLVKGVRLSNSIKAIFQQILTYVKKSNSENPIWVNDDIEKFFSSCTTIANALQLDYGELVTIFLSKIKFLRDEWILERNNNCSGTSSDALSENDISTSAVSVAIQNITSYLTNQYNTLKEGNKNDPKLDLLLESLHSLALKTYSLKSSLRLLANLEETELVQLTSDSEEIMYVFNKIQSFPEVEASFEFEIAPENILEISSHVGFRKYFEEFVDKLYDLEEDFVRTIVKFTELKDKDL